MPKRFRDNKVALHEELREDSQFAADYLNAALEESDRLFLRALRDVAEAYKMASVANEAGLSRESLYRTLSEEGNPRLSSLLGILRAVGVKIQFASAQPAS